MPTATNEPKKRGRPRKKPELPDDDDLIGAGPSAPATPAPRLNKDEQAELAKGLDLGVVFGGVSAAWLAHIFGMDKNTVKKKLADGGCPQAGMNKATPLYKIKDAAPYLVAPKVDIASYLKSLRPNDLPPILSDAFWAGQLKRQKWEENAGDLWRTGDVLEVLADTAKMIKTTVQLWTDELDRVQGLNDDQRASLTQMTDGLLTEIHAVMVASPQRSSTPSSLTEPERDNDDAV